MPIAVFVNETGDEINTHLFDSEEINFGQSSECDLTLSKGEIEILHGRLTLKGTSLYLQRESEAKVSVNGEIIVELCEFKESDVMLVGESLIAAQVYTMGEPPPLAPPQLTERVIQRDLVLRMGGARPPRSLNSIYNVIQDEEATQVQKPTGSLGAIFDAVRDGGESDGSNTAEEPLAFEPRTQVDPKSPLLSSSSDTPLPSKPRPTDPTQASSLDSIYNSLTPIPEELRQATTESSAKAFSSKKSAPLDRSNVSTTLPVMDNSIFKDLLSPPLLRLIEGAAIEEIHCIGAEGLSCRVRGALRSLSHERPFDDLKHAMRVYADLRSKLFPLDGLTAAGRLGDFWVSVQLVKGEPHLCLERLSPLVTEGVIADDLMPQLGKFMARGARFVIASPRGERRAAESVAALLLQRYGQMQRFGVIGVKRCLGDDQGWIELGMSDHDLRQAALLNLDGIIVGDHPSFTGGLLFDVLSDLPSSMILVQARNPEAAFHKVRWRSAHKHLAAATINMVIFAKEVDGQPKLSSIHSYATGEKVYQLPKA